jgi:Trp operon repressor
MTTREFPKTPAMQELEAIHGKPLDRLIRERYEAGETQRQIAAYLGVNVATVSRYMRTMDLPARKFGWKRTVPA